MTRRPSPESVAGAYADKARAPKNAGKLTWTEAMARAPLVRKLPAEQEQAFRRAYAELLVARGLALPAGRSRNSGANTHKAYPLRAPDEERDAWRRAAERAGMPMSEWIRDALRRAASKP